ncbi:unnamed protein product [Didymodactylos carnosus]|uniref:Uncharacterized protein n=1 Tax=Didymodactylos carnosus TaxID=1234261 RepID=A0A815ALH0_9BILA|nr:unnamed protein product [Didymodactylos carnosus]
METKLNADEKCMIMLNRDMRLQHIVYAVMLHNRLCEYLPDRALHIAGIINKEFGTFYSGIDVRSMFDVVSSRQSLGWFFNIGIKSMLRKYQLSCVNSFVTTIEILPFTSVTYNATIYDLSMMQDERTSAVQQTFQQAFLDRKNFQSAFLVFGACQFKFFMNNSYTIEIPFSLDKVVLKRWCEGIKNEMWKLFVIMWGNHKETRKCGSSTCSSCFVVDGQQKIDRPICRFKNVVKENYELGDVFVGCGETPIAESHFCDTHSYIGGTSTEADGMILEADNDCLDNPVSDCNVSRIEPETNGKRLTSCGSNCRWA